MNNHLFVSIYFSCFSIFNDIFSPCYILPKRKKKAVTHLRLLYVMIWFWMPFTSLNK